MKKITLLPLLFTFLSTVAHNPGKCAGNKNNPDVNYYQHNAKIATSEPEIPKKSKADTIPESELAKIKNEDIKSVSVIKDIIIVRLRNGDSVLSKKESQVEKRKKNTPSKYDEIFTKLEEEANYPGGPSGWMRYMNRTFRYPKEAMDKKVQGTIILQFIVDKKGKVSDVQAISGPTTGGLRREALRVVKGSGKWIPGKQNGQVVNSYKKQTVTFKLESY